MAANTVLNYLPRQSVVHKMTGTTKLAFFLLFTFASMITYNTWVLLGLMAVSFAAFKLSHIKLREVRFMLIFMLVFLLLNNLFIFLFDPNQGTTLYGTRHVLFHLFWRYDVTAEQLFYMVNISLKYFVALPVAILFISATNPSEFAASLNSIGISYKVGYSVAIALRYIPDIQRDYHSISQAQQARGVELGKKEPFFKRMKNSVNILLPLILTSLNRIDTIVMFMPLDLDAIRKIAEINIRKEIKKMAEKNVTVEIEPQVYDFIAMCGYQPEYGGRPVKRAITDHIINPLTNALIDGEISMDKPVLVTVDTDKIVFSNASATVRI